MSDQDKQPNSQSQSYEYFCEEGGEYEMEEDTLERDQMKGLYKVSAEAPVA